MKTIVIASNNAGKLREIQAILAPLNIRVAPQAEFGVSEAEEPHATFIENALTKARHASQLTQLPALADDSGLCVEALKGAPGVYSARYGGYPKSDANNNRALLSALQGQANRKAHYYCVMVFVNSPEDPQPLIAEGCWEGEIIDTPRGESGFGYDPLFFIPALGKTAAELSIEIKNQLSHRGQALRALSQKLQQFT